MLVALEADAVAGAVDERARRTRRRSMIVAGRRSTDSHGTPGDAAAVAAAWARWSTSYSARNSASGPRAGVGPATQTVRVMSEP